ncbi:hypothetical protein C7E23_12645 [Elizabethkingia anophelis]|nr:hypothetical protein C7E23_12645 [Elizabethkingia anophelis]
MSGIFFGKTFIVLVLGKKSFCSAVFKIFTQINNEKNKKYLFLIFFYLILYKTKSQKLIR